MELKTYNNLLVEIEDGIAVVTINRPKSLNALNSETLAELGDVASTIEKSKEVKVVILTGSGQKAFVAGADISEMVNASAQEGRAMALLAAETFNTLENMPQVTIAAVNGYALGGGCEISMACDIRVAAENAKFGQPEVNLGILPGFGGTQRLPRLANKVVPQAELLDYCKAMAKKIMSKASFGVTLAKQAINTGMDTDLASGLKLEANLFGLSFATHDKAEGMAAFLEKRKADLTDF